MTSDDLDGLRLLRDHAPTGMLVVAGEYTYHPWAAQQLLKTQAVNVLQLDATRCLGFTGVLLAAAAADAAHVPVSTHTAPQLHVHLAPGIRDIHSLEWFHRPGNGLTPKVATATEAA